MYKAIGCDAVENYARLIGPFWVGHQMHRATVGGCLARLTDARAQLPLFNEAGGEAAPFAERWRCAGRSPGRVGGTNPAGRRLRAVAVKILGWTLATLLMLFAVLAITQGPVAAPPWWGNDGVWWPGINDRWWDKPWR